MAEGLLDFLNSPGGMGLLSAVGAGLAGARRGGALNAVGSGLLGGVQGYAQGQQFQQQQQFNQQRQKLFDSQVAENEAQVKARQLALERQQRVDGALRDAFTPVAPIDANRVSGVVGPRAQALDVVGQRKPVDFQSLIAMGVPMDTVKGLAEAPNLGRAKVARTVEGQDAQGNKMTYQLDEFGGRVGDGVAGYTAPVQVDLGGRVQFVKPQAGVNLSKTMTPGEIASNAVARGNLAVSQGRFAFDQRQAQQGKPEFRDGQWVVPPRDMRPGDVRPVTAPTASRDAAEALNLIKQARELLPTATGSYGGVAVDQVNRVFGRATEGAKTTAQLQAIEGALVSKMPKMSGPQSDKDVALYKQMAGVVGDPTVPVEQRQSALDTIEEIQTRYAGQSGGASGSFGAPKQGGAKFLGFE